MAQEKTTLLSSVRALYMKYSEMWLTLAIFVSSAITFACFRTTPNLQAG